MPEKLKIFLSYAHEDAEMKTALDSHLISLKKSNKVEVWQDTEILPGDNWDNVINEQLNAAHIILLLISVDFLNSKYIWEVELQAAMQKHEAGTVRVVPIILRTCDWTSMPFAKLNALPLGAKPVSSFADKDVAYTEIVTNINIIVNFLLN